MYIDLEKLKEEYKIAPKEIIDTCLAVLLQSENKDSQMTLSETIASATLAANGVLKIQDKEEKK